MGTTDIRSEKDWVDEPSIREDTEWAESVVVEGEIDKKTKAVPTAIPMTGDKGQQLLGPDGNPMGFKSVVSRTKDEIQQLWDLKMLREPCFLCRFYQPNQISKEQKTQLWKNMSAEHGLRREWVAKEFGNPDNYEYCCVYEILTHKNASCPKHWKPRF